MPAIELMRALPIFQGFADANGARAGLRVRERRLRQGKTEGCGDGCGNERRCSHAMLL